MSFIAVNYPSRQITLPGNDMNPDLCDYPVIPVVAFSLVLNNHGGNRETSQGSQNKYEENLFHSTWQ